jgi:hypothetical protein
MAIMQIPDGLATELAHIPEAAMGVQAAQISDTAVLVVRGQIAILPDKKAAKQLEELTERPWIRDTQSHEAQISDFNAWRSSLPVAHNLTLPPQQPTKVLLGFILLGPSGPLPLHTIAPPSVYGHLQFHGVTQANDIFYRYEPFPTSRRINPATNTIAPNTFAAPESELKLTPSGFSAVARFALPSLFPARWRWELKPAVGVVLKCGASVPLYGQSGGGVEVMFVARTTTRSPILNPYVLDAL